MNKDEIMKQFDEAIKNLKEWVEDKSRENSEWEVRFNKEFVLPHYSSVHHDWKNGPFPSRLIDFIRQEFVKMGQEIIQPDNGIIELSAYPAEAYRQGIDDMKYKVNEALRKRGVE